MSPHWSGKSGYETAKMHQARIYSELEQRSAALQRFPRAPNGLTPDAVKFSPEYREAKRAYDIAFQSMRDFNEHFTRMYKTEIRQERWLRNPTLR